MKRSKSSSPSSLASSPQERSVLGKTNALAAGTLTSGNLGSGNATAKRAAAILLGKKVGFHVPTAKQKLNLLVAFAKRNMVVYGKAFDIVKLLGPVDLDELSDIENKIDNIRIFEIKSTRKGLASDFSKFFFGLTAAEVLVAQSLKGYFKFVFVNTVTEDYLELNLPQIFAKAKGIYPTWSICF